VYSLADYRRAGVVVKLPAPAFPPTGSPGLDFNNVGHTLTALAKLIRKGSGAMSPATMAKLLDGLAANAQAACRRGHQLEHNLLLAERVLSSQLGGLEGKALTRAIKKEAAKVRVRFGATRK
jgi:hypothetical protein